ncbi:MAG: type IVB secretion system lipoprotein DotD [Gammaproteobacteria bacterium]|nr:type IVB secretion system lipoprotein DotD [Gammaproteobacteria bacterium]
MKNNNYIVLLMFLICAAGCTPSLYKKPPYNDPSDDATIKLAEAANSVSDSILDMAKTEKVLTPANKDNTLTIPNARGLQTHASVDWSGPIGEVILRSSKAAHYHLRVLGNAPAIPILVSVHLKDTSLGEILRNIDYQAGNKASIHVYPNNKVIELRYANLYS